MTWRETYDTVLKYFRSKGDKEAVAKEIVDNESPTFTFRPLAFKLDAILSR